MKKKRLIFPEFSALGMMNEDDEVQKRINEEYREFGDIVQVIKCVVKAA